MEKGTSNYITSLQAKNIRYKTELDIQRLDVISKSDYNKIIEDAKNELEMQIRKQILANHKFSITEMVDHRKTGDIHRYRTYLPDEKGNRGKIISRSSLRELQDAIVDFYLTQMMDDIPTVDDVYKQWVAYHHKLNNSSDSTIDKYKTDYERFIKDSDLAGKHITKVSEVDLENFFLDCITSYVGRKGEKGLEYKAFSKLYGYMDGLFRYAYKHKIIESNPILYLDKRDFRNACKAKREKTAETELISDDKFDALLAQLYKDMERSPSNFTFYAVELAAKTGMRVGEIATLKWYDINYKDGYIEISRSDKYHKVRDDNGNIVSHSWSIERTKTKKRRRFPIDDSIRKSLDRIKKAQFACGCVSEWLFPHPEYGWTRSNLISSCIKNKCKQLGFDRTYGIHALRKTLNSDMRNNNASSKMCSSMLGNTPEVNDKYYYYDNSDMDLKRDYVKNAHAKRAYM